MNTGLVIMVAVCDGAPSGRQQNLWMIATVGGSNPTKRAEMNQLIN